MPENEISSTRKPALVALILAMSMIVLYVTGSAAPRTQKPKAALALELPEEKPAGKLNADRNQVLPLITSALRNSEFGRARELTERAPQSTRRQMMQVISSAEMHRLLEQIAEAISSNRHEQARSFTRSLADQRTQDQLMQIIDFDEGRNVLGQGDVETASRLASTLPPGVKRVLLLTGVAAYHAKAGERTPASACLHIALREIDHVEAQHKQPLLAMVARLLLSVEPESGLVVLDRAIHEGEPVTAARDTLTSTAAASSTPWPHQSH